MSSDIGLSVVIPVYWNQGSLRRTTDDLVKDVFDKHPQLVPEIVYVDDGSGDGSLGELLELQRERPGLIRIVKLTRNFGQPAARLAGLRLCRGKLVVSMSADGQDPASLVDTMIQAHREHRNEIVICTRVGRDESAWRVWTSGIFYSLMRKLSFPNMPAGGFDFVLVTRRVLDVVLQNQDATPFFQGQLLWTGFTPRFIPYHRRAREVGRSRWTFGKKLTLLIDAVLNYSFFPIRLVSAMGLLFAVAGFLTAGALFARYFVLGSSVPGWTTLVVLVLVMGGFQTLTLGVIGEYLWRVLAETRQRSLYVVDTVFEAPNVEVR